MKLKTGLLLISALFLLGCGVSNNPYQASGALFHNGHFACSGTVLKGNLFLTARHCVLDEDQKTLVPAMISLSDNEEGPYYKTVAYEVSRRYDVAILKIVTNDTLPHVQLGHPEFYPDNSPIFNISFPYSTGKTRRDGQMLKSQFSHLPDSLITAYPEWALAMPIDCTWGPGSSGSGIFSEVGNLEGIVVGITGAGNLNIGESVNAVYYLMGHPEDNYVSNQDGNLIIGPPPDFEF